MDFNDVHGENGDEPSYANFDSDSHLISEREEEFAKQESATNSAFAGIRIDFNDVQWENADAPSRNSFDLDSNVISESEEQFAKL
jgi:hypothetical protein